MIRLHKSEWLNLAPDDPGTVRVNHESTSCTGSSKSMKITRTDDDRVFAKCYRCGGFGSHNGGLSGYGSFARATSNRTPTTGTDLTLPSDFCSDIRKMPVEVKVKLNQAFITQDHVTKYGMGWSEKWQRFIMPVYRDGEVKGIIARYFGNEDLPRFITRYKDDSDLWTYINPSSVNLCRDAAVIVEDLWSAIRVSKFCPSVALLGTEIGDKCLDHVSNCHDKFAIFLDDDNLMVKKKAMEIKDRLTMMGKRVNIILSGGKDPKEYTDEELQDILKETIDAL